ncbi:MAG: DUF2752 domain-containing protein [Acidimicrobiales bacterium]
MLATPLARRLGPAQAVPASMALGAMCGCALVALVDPNESGRYPLCPTRALLGIDCPACGTLRGLHALSRGQVGTALNHNLLLLLAVPVGAVIWLQWVRAALGRPPRSISLPRWALPTMIVLATVFAVVRNLPIRGLTWLDSAA